jgi:hypothetical protein
VSKISGFLEAAVNGSSHSFSMGIVPGKILVNEE